MAYGTIVASRYWNANGTITAIVAVEGGNNDVAAYIGGDPDQHAHRADTIQHVAAHGSKLTKNEAHGMLPELADIPLTYRR